MTAILETRTGKAGSIELRAKADGAGTLFGYAITYGNHSRNLGGFVEQVAPGAVDNSLRDQVRVMARYNHDNAYLLGTTDAGTLRLESDDFGLLYDIDLPDTNAGRDVHALAARGDLKFSSFAFYALDEEWSLTAEDFLLRTITQLHLVDVAPVNDPAYLDTTTGLRAVDSPSFPAVRAAMQSLAERTGLDLDALSSTPVEEIRARISGEPPPSPAQRATHVGERLSVRRRRLELAKL